ncbi:MAG: sulfatase-like hydrolase/transferase [Spirochaetia bacterium]|nr:sulfatase-like hydrolase/transferase [Spirochaetia bacterium]
MKRKNVLLITVDQWSGKYLGCAGENEILTPSLDELANYGIRYTNAISTTPVSIPARRELMLGVGDVKHGDRIFNTKLEMPSTLPTLAQVFRNNGYQAYATGKLHVFPQRNRIGFDDVHLCEEGRHFEGLQQDDYERFLMKNGFPGLEFAHGMCNNDYFARPFHLDEAFHPTTWATRDMCETIKRRDPTRPAFWYLSYSAPHPPLVPPKDYMDMYEDIEFREPYIGDWVMKTDTLPFAYQYYSKMYHIDTKRKLANAKKAYYATCTHIDHQIRLVIGTLREEGILEDTILLFTADHGEMLGNHNLWGKFLMYENSVNIPMILIPTYDSDCQCGVVDDRLVELKDIMPTLLKLTGLEIPDDVDGISMLDQKKRTYSYCELWEDDRATRMILTQKYKLIYYAVGNQFQFFDRINDPNEMHDLIAEPAYRQIILELKDQLKAKLHGKDSDWIKNGKFVGLPSKDYQFISSLKDNNKLFRGRDMKLQRGIR